MPLRRRAMALIRSERSVCRPAICCSTSVASVSARRLTGPILSRSRAAAAAWSRLASRSGISPSSSSAIPAVSSGVQSSRSRMRLHDPGRLLPPAPPRPRRARGSRAPPPAHARPPSAVGRRRPGGSRLPPDGRRPRGASPWRCRSARSPCRAARRSPPAAWSGPRSRRSTAIRRSVQQLRSAVRRDCSRSIQDCRSPAIAVMRAARASASRSSRSWVLRRSMSAARSSPVRCAPRWPRLAGQEIGKGRRILAHAPPEPGLGFADIPRGHRPTFRPRRAARDRRGQGGAGRGLEGGARPFDGAQRRLQGVAPLPGGHFRGFGAAARLRMTGSRPRPPGGSHRRQFLLHFVEARALAAGASRPRSPRRPRPRSHPSATSRHRASPGAGPGPVRGRRRLPSASAATTPICVRRRVQRRPARARTRQRLGAVGQRQRVFQRRQSSANGRARRRRRTPSRSSPSAAPSAASYPAATVTAFTIDGHRSD